MKFREITSQDIAALFEVRISTDENNFSMEELSTLGITKISVEKKLNSTFKGWLCEISKKIIGFIIADNKTAEIWVIAVRPEYIKRGIGTKLMQLAENWLQINGARRLWLTTDTDKKLRAFSFYKNRGWNEYKTEKGILYMEKIIP